MRTTRKVAENASQDCGNPLVSPPPKNDAASIAKAAVGCSGAPFRLWLPGVVLVLVVIVLNEIVLNEVVLNEVVLVLVIA